MIGTEHIVLCARKIVRRFVSRSDKRPTNPWRAVVLRWRRTKKPIATQAARSPRSHVSLSQTQFHFHLTAYLTGLRLRDRFIQFAPLTAGRRTGDLTRHSGHSDASVTRRVHPTPTLPRYSVSYRVTRARRHFASVTNPPARPKHRIVLVPTLIVPIHLPTGRQTQSLLGTRNKLELPPSLTQTLSTQAPLRQSASRGRPRSRLSQLGPTPPSNPFRIPSYQWEPLGHRHSPLMRPTASKSALPRLVDQRPRTAANESQRIPQTVAEEFVWRQRVASIATGKSESDQERASSTTSSPSRSSRRQEANLTAQVIERAKVQPLAQLDSAVLDQVTDNVIRRVEQRLRIERQRRGL